MFEWTQREREMSLPRTHTIAFKKNRNVFPFNKFQMNNFPNFA